jgi:hypothetical protein
MSAVDDLDELIEQFHLVQGEFVKGNHEPCKRLFSQREDVTLKNRLSSRKGAGTTWVPAPTRAAYSKHDRAEVAA